MPPAPDLQFALGAFYVLFQTKMDAGFIKLHRKLLDWEWYDDINTKVLFLHLLLTVNWEDKKWHWIDIKRWQVLTWRIQLSKETWLTEQQIRTSLTKLKSTNEITIKITNRYSIIEITNYDRYQSNQPANEPTSNQQVTTTKEIEELKEYKNIADENSKDVYPYFLYCFIDLWWKPWSSDTVDSLKEWMRKTLKEWWINSASDAIFTLREFHKYWDTRRDEKWFKKKNWKTTLINSPSLPNNKNKYATK